MRFPLCPFFFLGSSARMAVIIGTRRMKRGERGEGGGGERGGVDSKSWRWRDVGRETSHTKLKGYRRGLVKDVEEEREIEREREARRRKGKGRRGKPGAERIWRRDGGVAERAEVTFNVSRHAAQGSVSLASSSLLIWRQFPSNLPSKN